MARKKVQLTYIADDSARKATYKKRKKGLLKKVSELTTLCGVEACAIVSSPYEPEPVLWPDHERARKVVEDFRDLPKMDRHRRMFNHPAYLWQRISKSSQQLGRLQRDNREKSVELAMFGCLAGEMSLDDLTGMDRSDLDWMIERKIAEIGRQLEALGQGIAEPVRPAPQQLIPNVGLSMHVLPAQFTTAGASVFGMGTGGLAGMPTQEPAMWQFDRTIEAGGSSGAGSSFVPPVSDGEHKCTTEVGGAEPV